MSNEPEYLEWSVEKFEKKCFLVGFHEELQVKLFFLLGNTYNFNDLLSLYDSETAMMSNLLDYFGSLRFDHEYLKTLQTLQTITFESQELLYSIFFADIKMHKDYQFLAAMTAAADDVIIQSTDDIRFCFENPTSICLGFENRHITKVLLRFNQKIALFWGANPDKLTDFTNLSISDLIKSPTNTNTMRADYVSRFISILKVTPDGEVIIRDKDGDVYTLSEMRNWNVQKFIVQFELNRQLAYPEYLEKYHLCREVVSLKKALQKRMDDPSNKNHLYVDWIVFESSRVEEIYSYADPRVETLIKRIRNSLNDDDKTLELLHHVSKFCWENSFSALQNFLDNELCNYPLEWSLPVLDGLIDK